MRMRMRMRIRDGDGAWRPMENARFFFSALAISTAPEAQATARAHAPSQVPSGTTHGMHRQFRGR